MTKFNLLLLVFVSLMSFKASAELDVYDTSSNELRPFIIADEEALGSWAGVYEVTKCIECDDSFKKDGELLSKIKGAAISFVATPAIFMKPHFQTHLDICFTEYRKENLTSIDCFGMGLKSYIQKSSGKKKVVSLGVRKDKFFYRLHDDFTGEYDKIEAIKDLKSGDIILTREKKDLDPAFNRPRIIKYKVKLKLKKYYTIKLNLKL